MADQIDVADMWVAALRDAPEDNITVAQMWVCALIDDVPPPPRVRSRASVRGHLLERFTEMSVPVTSEARITEAGDKRITEAGDTRVLEGG